MIFLTVRDTQADKVTRLTIGGDAYMTKLVGLDELAAGSAPCAPHLAVGRSLDDEVRQHRA